MHVEFTPTVVEARIYRQGGYKERSAYVGSMVIHMVGDEAWISLLTNAKESECAAWSRAIDRQVETYLVEQGIRWASYECGGRKVRRDIGRQINASK